MNDVRIVKLDLRYFVVERKGEGGWKELKNFTTATSARRWCKENNLKIV